MKTLFLLRHAKSAEGGSLVRDFDRPLTAEGRAAGVVMGRWMAEAGIGFDHVLASPAARVRETLVTVAEGHGQVPGPAFEPRIYLAAAADLLEVVAAAPAGAARLLLVGHNPGLERLLLRLVPAGAPGRAAADEKYPTAALAEIALDVGGWAEVRGGVGTLVRFVRPRDLEAVQEG